MPLNEFSRSLQKFGIGFSKLTHAMLIEVKPEEVSLLQFEVLHFLYTEDAVTFGRIAACTGMSLPNTSREVKKLMEKSLVTKTPGTADKRTVFVHLSPAGEELMAAASEKLANRIAERFAHLDGEDIREVRSALSLLSEKLLGEQPG